MKQWWLEIVPGPRSTRVVLMNSAGQSVLRARLPYGPTYPQAPRFLCESLAMWCEGTFNVVLAVVGKMRFSVGPWSEALPCLCSPRNWQIELVSPPQRPDFANIERQLRTIVRRR
jgi:hypothetical protein